MSIQDDIKKLAKEKKAIILAHNYQPADIQDIADYTGDSLELSRIAAQNDAPIIVFCGVHFMAESAAILSPQKKVILPVLNAGCPMAEMADPEDVLRMKGVHPEAAVVTYINSTAAVKAVSDVICTSSNAVRIVERIENNTIIFVPDRNLGAFVQRHTNKKIILWDGFCPTHEAFTKEDLLAIMKKHPYAFSMVHPECRPEVLDLADGIFSTGQMVSFVKITDRKKIIVGTESGMIHKLKKTAPRIEYIPATGSFLCPNMKKITLDALYRALDNEGPIITVDESTRQAAYLALEKMLQLSQ
jgi:quinolinate synthase